MTKFGFGYLFGGCINLFLGISEIHEYSGKETIRSIFMSLLFIAILLLLTHIYTDVATIYYS